LTGTKEILQTALSAQINDTALSLRRSSLVAVKDSAGTVQYFPRTATNILFCDRVLNREIILQYDEKY